MITTEDLKTVSLFADVDARLLARIASRVADIRVKKNEWIFQESDPAAFWAVIAGEVEMIKVIGGVQRQTTTFDPGEFFGEVPLMLGAATFSGCRALRDSRLLRLDANDFHNLVIESPQASAILAQTLVRRVNAIQEIFREAEVTRATIVGDRYDLACHDVRDFLYRNHIPFEWLDPNNDADRTCIAPEILASAIYPTVIVDDGSTLVEPSDRDIAVHLGLQTKPDNEEYDVAIIGGGPAGLAAAVYGGSEGLRTIMIEREAPGGQAGTSSRIENYLGFPGGISGDELANRALMQAKRFGTEILVTREVQSMERCNEGFSIALDGGDIVRTRAIVIATGVTWRTLEIENADRLVGRGVYYGAARTEALGMRGKEIFLIGGGNSAGQAAMFFANYAHSVRLLVRSDDLAKSMSHYLIEQLGSKDNVHVEVSTQVIGLGGDGHLESIVTQNGMQTSSARKADGLFVFIGADAVTTWLPKTLERDARGYIKTGRDIAGWSDERYPFSLETSIPGIFAAGDVRSNSVKRVASGVGEGSMVIAYVHQYLETLRTPA